MSGDRLAELVVAQADGLVEMVREFGQGDARSLLRARAIWLALTPMRFSQRRTWARKMCERRQSSDSGRWALKRPVRKARTMSAAKPDSPL